MRLRFSHLPLAIAVLALPLSLAGCGGGDSSGVQVPALQITTTTEGTQPDPDGYTYSVDGGPAQPIGPDATATVEEIAAGEHSVELAGLAPNCSAGGTNPQTIEVTANATATVTFAVTCGESPTGEWLPLTSGTSRQLTGVWGSSASDVFAVGESLEEVESGILHYDGQAWSEQLGSADLVLRAVWGASATDVYAVGWQFDLGVGAILHYDGSQWQTVEGPVFDSGDEPSQAFYSSVSGSSASDVFLVGSVATEVDPEQAVIAHYDGAAWSLMDVPSPQFLALTDVSAGSAGDVYAVGTLPAPDDEGATALVVRYDGARWREVLSQEGVDLEAIWAGPNGEAFAVGAEGAIWHSDGTSWSAMESPSSDNLSEVWGTSTTDVFAVGDQGTILHYDGTEWSSAKPTDRPLFDIWGASGAGVFAVGDEGTILRNGQ
ncbi:MAG: hypothetical protein ACREMX_09225 [Gemmatimonadales bacterium]